MFARVRVLLSVLALVHAAAIAAPPAMAGQTCREVAVTPAEVRAAAAAAITLRDGLDATGARVALVARVGGDISRHGLKYTHVGFAWRDNPRGRWVVVHAVNPCGTGRSVLYNHGLMRFFLDDPLVRDSLVLVPDPDLGRHLAALLASGAAAGLHQPRYNMIAYPGGDFRYQNSNQWVLEVIGLALARAEGRTPTDRAAVGADVARRGFRGSVVRIGFLERLGSALARPGIHFDDHPAEDRARGRFQVVTVRAVADFLDHTGHLARRFELGEPPAH